jgi:hypothetical protein
VAAKTIRKFLSKENYARPHVQYNAVMLIRILADNPGATFTRNMDGKFTTTVKELLRTGKDPSVQQILRETLAALYVDKAYDTNLTALFQMWAKESGGAMPPPNARGGINAPMSSPPMGYQQQPRENYQRRRHENGLPGPGELAQRIEEAKTSAKLLQQLVQSTPPAELQGNDLVKEFAERCQTAQRSVQGYINCDNPAPDDETMQTLIETSEQLSLAASKHQRAVLQARRAVANASPLSNISPPPGPPPQTMSSHERSVENTGYSSPGAPPSSTFTPTEAQSFTAYSPPPVPPPSMRANLERRSTDPKAPSATITTPDTSLAPQIPAAPRQNALELPAPQYDNPFSDAHGHTDEDEDDDPYHHPKPTNPATSSTLATVGTRPAPRDPDSWRDPIPEEDSHNESYHPNFTSTPSYVKRQESATDNLTMHGAATSPREAVSPVYEPNSGEVSPVFDQHRYNGGKGSSAAPGYRY